MLEKLKTKAKQGLVGLVAGASLFLGTCETNTAKAETYRVGTNESLQEYIDAGQDGDEFVLYRTGREDFTSGFSTDKTISVRSDDSGYQWYIWGGIRVYGNGNVRLNNLVLYGGNGALDKIVIVEDNASLEAINNTFGTGITSVYFNSTGNLRLDENQFSEQEWNNSAIYLEKVAGTIDITKNLIHSGNRGITINQDSGEKVPTLNILNNTLVRQFQEAISFDSYLTYAEGNVSNNAIVEGNIGIKNFDNRGKVVVNKNNLYANAYDYFETPPESGIQLMSLALSPETYDDYYVEPGFIGSGDYGLQNNSEMIGKGRYIENVTTWFPNPQTTWIGAYPPSNIPEASTLGLLALGIPLYLKRREKIEK